MDTIPSSRKRNRPYGTITRTRSQLCLHRNRSGQLRFDPVSTQDEPYAERVGFGRIDCKKPKKRDGCELSYLLAKDLRARRVYSPRHSTDSGLVKTEFPKGGADDSGCADEQIADLRNDATESPYSGLSSDPRSNAVSLDGLPDGRGKNCEDCSEKNDGLDEVTTLYEAEICGGSTPQDNDEEKKQEADVPVKDTPATGKDSSRNDFSLKSKFVLRPRFQGKLYRAPGSVNYRRLFPFLMDTIRDDPATSKLGSCQNDKEVVREFQLPLSSQSQEEPKKEFKTDATADYGVIDVGSDVPSNDSKQLSSHMNNLDCGEASNRSACTSQELCVLNEECIQTTPPDADIYDNSKVNVKTMDLTGSTRENAGEGFCLKAAKRKDSLKSKSLPRQHLQRKLFKTPGSISYKKLLPFLMDLIKDDSDKSKFDNQSRREEDEAVMHAKRFQLPLSSQSGEPSMDEYKTDSSPMHGTIESNGLGNYLSVNPSNELSHGNQPKLTPFLDLRDLAMQLDGKEVLRKDLSAPSVNEHIENFAIGSKDKSLTVSGLNLSAMAGDFHSAKNVVDFVHNDDFKEVQNKISKQDNSESSPNDQNMLQINGDVSEETFVRHSRKEKGLTVDYDEGKQFVNLKEHESVSKFPSEGQSLSQLDSNVVVADENVASLDHVRVSNDIHRSPSEKIISEKSDMEGRRGGKASVQNGIVSHSRMHSKGSDKKYASDIKNDTESKITSVLKRSPQFNLLRQSGSLNYKRLLPFLLNTTKNNSLNDHYPKLAKSMGETPLPPISTSNLRLTPVGGSNGRVHMERCTDEHDVFNGLCKPESSTDPSVSVQGIGYLPITSLAPVIGEVISTEEKATPALSKSSVFSEVTENSSFLISSNEEKPPETPECCQSLSQLQVAEQLRIPSVDFKKGILKRNPRGCRGLCTCLNCVSFRLNAERAFEFSRNQLLDADEVAHALLKEVSHLRNMLERCADSVNDNPVFDGSQMKEACKKAFEAEKLAKDRLSQMHDDLNIHCRIASLQAPRVTFAVHVEEKVIQPGR